MKHPGPRPTGALLLALALVPATAGCRGDASGPPAAAGGAAPGCPGCNVVLISIDTLRADHLGSYGYPRDTSPRLDAFAAGAVVFECAYSASYHTAESHMSLFTSVYPSVHRVRNAADDRRTARLSPGIVTLAEALQGAGYRTAGFHGGGNVSAGYGFDRGFGVYRRVEGIEPAIGWVERNAAAPFFLFFHTYRVHDPYLPDPPYDLFGGDYRGPVIASEAALEAATAGDDAFSSRRDAFWAAVREGDENDLRRLVSLYDGVIRQADEELWRLIAAIEALAPRTVFVVLSDHGEEFREHGRFIHDQLYEELLHVPLIVKLPEGRGAGRRVPGRVSLVDVAPTLLELLGLPPLGRAQGASLVPMLDGAAGAVRDQVFSEKVVGRRAKRPRSNASLIVDGMKLIVSGPGSPRTELYDLEDDPGERSDLAAAGGVPRELKARLRSQLAENQALHDALTAGEEPSSRELGDEEVRQLEALGYL